MSRPNDSNFLRQLRSLLGSSLLASIGCFVWLMSGCGPIANQDTEDMEGDVGDDNGDDDDGVLPTAYSYDGAEGAPTAVI